MAENVRDFRQSLTSHLSTYLNCNLAFIACHEKRYQIQSLLFVTDVFTILFLAIQYSSWEARQLLHDISFHDQLRFDVFSYFESLTLLFLPEY